MTWILGIDWPVEESSIVLKCGSIGVKYHCSSSTWSGSRETPSIT